ncbi:hypothetical protein JX265_010386 [Neoarthrinium moseri]|uniref:SnoaL-like domain-containing protein n=1 Tax=Neoarthrinium moseri TaxID=1658444 RepID=A0A9Q0ALM6_9PEZI|nr:hypothetical protein JX266_011350 [Neoarthrinium moseri]KAI1859383.1 hypothetical protein JX265_010386 [Neoarthrinium moseri]
MASKRVETAKKYIDHFATLDTQILESILADDYSHEFGPASIQHLTPPSFDKRGKIEHMQRLRRILSGFPVTAKQYIDSEESNKVVIWATSKTVFRAEAMDDSISPSEWEFNGEYVFILSMDANGDKITRTVEFLDSKETVDKLLVLMKKANENLQKG